MSSSYRIVSWRIHEDGSKSVYHIHEFAPTHTESGTQRKIGRSILFSLNNCQADQVTVEKRVGTEAGNDEEVHSTQKAQN